MKLMRRLKTAFFLGPFLVTLAFIVVAGSVTSILWHTLIRALDLLIWLNKQF